MKIRWHIEAFRRSDFEAMLTIGMTMLLLVEGLSVAQTSAQHGLVAAQDNTYFAFPVMGRMHWTGNRLAGCEYCDSNPILWAVDRQGRREAVAFQISGADHTYVYEVASGSDGSLTAVGLATSGDVITGNFIAWISPDTTRQVVTRVWPFSPNVVTVASDGTIWTVGAVMNDNFREVNPNVLRHYTPAGQLLASTIVRGTRPNSGGAYRVSSISALMASNDRIGWLTDVCQYFEFSFEPVQLGSYSCPNRYTKINDVGGVALSSANDLLLGSKWLAPLAPLELDRASKTWKPVPVARDSGNTRNILGFDGLTLVTSPMSSSMRTYAWSDQPSVGGQ
jgi:hypothetical protein